MVGVLANKALEFKVGDKAFPVKEGFNFLPDEVKNDPFFNLAMSDKSIIPFESTSDKSMEDALKLREENEKLKSEIEKLRKSKSKTKDANQDSASDGVDETPGE